MLASLATFLLVVMAAVYRSTLEGQLAVVPAHPEGMLAISHRYRQPVQFGGSARHEFRKPPSLKPIPLGVLAERIRVCLYSRHRYAMVWAWEAKD